MVEGTPSTSSHLSYPATTSVPPVASTSTSTPASQSRQVLKDRLYVGNLHPSVDEYTLIQLFSKFGKLSHLDYLFHKSGPLKGKPRGYAFVEFAEAVVSPSAPPATSAHAHPGSFLCACVQPRVTTPSHVAICALLVTDAMHRPGGSARLARSVVDSRALSVAHNKLLRGRRLVVTHAHQAPLDAAGSTSTYRRSVNEAGRPTALSLLKSGMKTRTKDKIAIMEAKLRQIEQDKARESRSSSPTRPSCPGSLYVQAISTAAHATPLARPSTNSPRVPDASKDRGRGRSKLPLAPKRLAVSQAQSLDDAMALGFGKSSGAARKPAGAGSALKGVKIGKKKAAVNPAEVEKTGDGGAAAKSLVGLGDGYGSDMDE
ncbi:hypothetical protein EVG20_g3743 [Dentipellis fragilis]|uniref:RRM domain-containing protein n=1 Tax=Dentipellis fragilis TaxID=205917 RepID=A0A4Y9Z1T2_9AGAM|nr:hypothetical protein EVG20_g3743 [Dentipellis fragilis]